MTHFDLQVVLSCFGANLDFLDLKGCLLLFGFLLLFGLFVFEPAIVHDFTDGGLRIRRNFYEVETKIIGFRNGLVGWHDANLFAVRIYQPNFTCLDVLVDVGPVASMFCFGKSYPCTSSVNWLIQIPQAISSEDHSSG